MARKKGLVVRDEWVEKLLALDEKELGELFSAMLRFHKDNTSPNKDKDPLWQTIFSQLKASAANSLNGAVGGNPNLKSNEGKSGKARQDSFFDRFWAAYPKKVGKEYAKQCFLKRGVDEILLNKMIDAINQQKETDGWHLEGGRFIPNPSTWLNQGRWQDEGVTIEKKKSIYDGLNLGVEL